MLKKFLGKCMKWCRKHSGIIIVAMFFMIVVITQFALSNKKSDPVPVKNVPYTEFMQMVSDGKVKDIKISFADPKFTFEDKNKNMYETDNPKVENFKEDMLVKGIDVKEVDGNAQAFKQSLIRQLINMVFYLVVFIWIMKSIKGTMGKNQKKEIAKENMPTTTFAQIAGNDEAKEDMIFLVEFLKNPQKFAKMGAKLPKGVIFYGPPGTGKTLTAKAIAGEAGVSFFSVSGSDFVEMFAGMGASRVRELFQSARKKAPAIIFIDEIDAIGGNRDHASHSEQRQTLNAILKEMDGFESSEGIIVIGATNRLADLDPAFIRPGRFDKHIAIELPDQKGRLEILQVHAKNKPFDPSVSLEEVSKMTIGFSGASLESLLNEAAILATTRNHEAITMEDIDDAHFKILMKGHKKKSGNKREDDELKLVAWHEAGHALAAKLLTKNEVPKVTIIPSTSGAGGVTFFNPKKISLLSKEDLMNDIKVSYAGRVAEYLLLGKDSKVTTGASADIRQATDQIKQMIASYGMSQFFGMLNLEVLGNSKDLLKNDRFVEEAAHISKKLYNQTLLLLNQHKHTLEAIANALLKQETLTEEELDAIIESCEATPSELIV